MFKQAIASCALGASMLFGGTALAEPVYLVATVTVEDFDAYMADYGSVAIPAIVEAGGEILVAAPETSVLEGEYGHNWTVVVKFPSEEAAMGWYNSETYQAVIPARHAVTDTGSSVMLIADQFAPPAE